LTAAEAGALRNVGRRLDEAIATAARNTSADLVQASALSADHALGSSDPWVTGFRPSMRPMPFHPNAEGMRAVAGALYQLLVPDGGD
jgi:lysophospholipase L1-like esterase